MSKRFLQLAGSLHCRRSARHSIEWGAPEIGGVECFVFENSLCRWRSMKLNLLKAVFLLALAAPALAQPPAAPKPIDLLKQKLEQISGGVSADWGIYIKALDTGEEIEIKAGETMDTMS